MNSFGLNEFESGFSIRMPQSIVRSVSLDKISKGAALTDRNFSASNTSLEKSNCKENYKGLSNAYKYVLTRKLIGLNQQQYTKDRKNISKELMANLSKQYSKPIFERYAYKINPKKLYVLRMYMDNNEMQYCTFRPHTNQPVEYKRSVEGFFKDQMEFNRKKTDKIDIMRYIIHANLYKENTFRPVICRQDEEYRQRTDRPPVHKRLYEEGRARQTYYSLYSHQKSQYIVKASSITKNKRFRGISRGNSTELKKRDIYSLESYSHGQSLRMPTKQSICTEQIIYSNDVKEVRCGYSKNSGRQCKIDVHRTNLSHTKLADSTRKYYLCAMKLMKYIMIVKQKLGISTLPSYLEMALLLEKLNLVSKDASVAYRKYLFDIWSLLQGNINGFVPIMSLIKIIFAIMNCHNIGIVNRCIQESIIDKDDNKSTQNILVLDEKDSKNIRNSFEPLYLNRLKSGESELAKEVPQPYYSFKPAISRTTNDLAERYRNRVINESYRLINEHKMYFYVPYDGYIDHVDLLMLDEKRKESLIQLKREYNYREKKKIEDYSMTSQIISEKNSHRSSQNACLGQKDRNKELYELGKSAFQARKDKSPDEIDLEKYKKDLTFKPNVATKTNLASLLHHIDKVIPDYDKVIFRMHEGRKQKYQQQQLSDRADLANNHHYTGIKEPNPLLYLNVVMYGQYSVKVPVFKKDTMYKITYKVRVMMKLYRSGNNCQQLEELLKSQILPALRKMGLGESAGTTENINKRDTRTKIR